MAFINFPSPTPIFPVLPPLAWSVHKKAIMASRATTAITGLETKLACCVYPRWEFTLTYGGDSWLRDETQNITPDSTLAGYTELEQLSSLFLACKGSYGEFYYTDPDDCSRAMGWVSGGNGTKTTYQIIVDYGNGGNGLPTFFMPVGGVNAISAVYFNGVVVSPSDYSIDATNTMLVFATAPAANVAITMDFTFYYRCRFSDDTQLYSQFALNKWEVKEIKFESVKP